MGFMLMQTGLPLAALSLCLPLIAHAQTSEAVPGLVVPEGWKLERKGENLVLQPGDLRDGALFYVNIKPLKPLSDTSLREWFTTQLEQDAAAQGKLLKDAPIQSPSGPNLLITTRGFQNDSGEQRMIGYVGFATSSGQARLFQIITTPKQEVYQPYMSTALKALIGMAKNDGMLKTKSTTARDDTPKTKAVPRPGRKVEEYRTAPGAGIKPSQILGVYMVLSYQAGVGGYIYPVYDPVIFLKDGTYCEDVRVPPTELDVVASRRGEPKRWGHWKRVGNEFQLQDEKGKWGKPQKLQEAKPGGKSEKLSGTFTTIGGGGNTAYGGGTMIAVSNSYTFAPNGSFKSGKSVGASSAEPLSDTSVTVASKKSSEGTYTIDNYTLTLRYSNGYVERRFFAYMDADKKTAIYINGSAYLNK